MLFVFFGVVGDKAGGAVEGDVVPCPLDENENTVVVLDDLHEVDDEPDEPSEEAGEFHLSEFCYGSGSSDGGEVAG